MLKSAPAAATDTRTSPPRCFRNGPTSTAPPELGTWVSQPPVPKLMQQWPPKTMETCCRILGVHMFGCSVSDSLDIFCQVLLRSCCPILTRFSFDTFGHRLRDLQCGNNAR
eukprot:1831389-Amphidinium_carterae.1